MLLSIDLDFFSLEKQKDWDWNWVVEYLLSKSLRSEFDHHFPQNKKVVPSNANDEQLGRTGIFKTS